MCLLQDQNEEHEIGMEGFDEDSAPPTPGMEDTFLRKEDTPATKTSHRNLARPTKRSTDKCDSVLGAIEEHFKKPKPAEDRYDVLGKHVAVKMRAVQDNIQRILAEKIISDALFMAEMGQLTMTHSIQQPSPTYSRCNTYQMSPQPSPTHSQYDAPQQSFFRPAVQPHQSEPRYAELQPPDALDGNSSSNSSLASYVSNFTP